ncbi:MAG: hypothetical protein H7338_25065 [Candidatus Sericytochromatia bacterium]|nr:hypothetical protein [Candidatus Sericytochromatia bacterium]
MPDVSVVRTVNDIFNQYDHNKNGTIELSRPDKTWGKEGRLRNPDERVRSSSTDISAFTDDTVNISTAVYTRVDLFRAADGNGDQKVTRDELTKFVATYDKNKDGILGAPDAKMFKKDTPEQKEQKQEIKSFKSDFPERLESYSNIKF